MPKSGLPIRNVLEVIKEYRTEGHQPLQVLADDFEIYVAKSGKGQKPPISVINELLCSFFLKCWEINTPTSVLLRIPPEIIDIPLSVTNKKSFYNELCFGSLLLQEAVEVNDLANSRGSWQFNKLKNPLDLIWIGLFDIWVENDDRKPSNPNLLLKECTKTSLFDIFAIDHAYTFLSTGYEVLDPSFGVSQSYNDSILFSDFVKSAISKIVKKRLFSDLRSEFNSKVGKCSDNFFRFVSYFPNEMGFNERLGLQLSNFLFDSKRNGLVFDEFLDRLH